MGRIPKKPFYPAAGYVRAYHVSCEGTSCSNLAIYTGPRLSTTTGIWITDTNVLRKLWDAVNNNKILTDSPNSYIRVSVQVEDLSILEPPPRYKEDPNKPSTTYNNNNGSHCNALFNLLTNLFTFLYSRNCACIYSGSAGIRVSNRSCLFHPRN